MHAAEIQARVETWQRAIDARVEIVCECLFCSTPIYMSQIVKWEENGKFTTNARPRGVQRFPLGLFKNCWMCATCRDFNDEVTSIHLTPDTLNDVAREDMIRNLRRQIWRKTWATIIAVDPEPKALILKQALKSKLLGPFDSSRHSPVHMEAFVRLARMLELEAYDNVLDS